MFARPLFSVAFSLALVPAMVGSTRPASAYVSNRIFFQLERAKADRAYAVRHGLNDSNSMLNWGRPAAMWGGGGGGYKVTQAGRPLKVSWFYSVRPDCRSNGPTTVNIVNPPSGGQVYTHGGIEYPSFPATNTHSSCNSRRVASTVVYYRPAPGFYGTDRFTIETIFPSGNARQHSYVVSVR